MNIIHRDFRQGKVKLRVDDPDDFWYLSHLIDPGDLVTGQATRKIKIGTEERTKAAKKTFTVTIEAETIELGAGGTSLRINGLIREGPEDIPKGSYQNISLEESSEFILGKVSWPEYQKLKLKEAAERKFSYLLCLFDREEALLALTRRAGYEILAKIKGEVAKKRQEIKTKKDFYQEIISLLMTYQQKFKPEAVILASPVFYKEDLLKRVTDPELKEKIVLAASYDVSESALDDVIKRPELAKVLQSSRTRREKLLVEELLSEINKNNLAVYGEEEVRKAVEKGAVNKLLVTDSFLRRKKERGSFGEIDAMMKRVDALKGEIHLISAEEGGGKELDGLGGMAAILRYKLR